MGHRARRDVYPKGDPLALSLSLALSLCRRVLQPDVLALNRNSRRVGEVAPRKVLAVGNHRRPAAYDAPWPGPRAAARAT